MGCSGCNVPTFTPCRAVPHINLDDLLGNPSPKNGWVLVSPAGMKPSHHFPRARGPAQSSLDEQTLGISPDLSGTGIVRIWITLIINNKIVKRGQSQPGPATAEPFWVKDLCGKFFTFPNPPEVCSCFCSLFNNPFSLSSLFHY